MKKIVKLLIAIFVFNLIFGNITYAVQISPDTLRVGLYYETYAKKSFTISAEKGLIVTTTYNGNTIKLFETSTKNYLGVYRDTFYNRSGTTLTEYSSTIPTIKPTPSPTPSPTPTATLLITPSPISTPTASTLLVTPSNTDLNVSSLPNNSNNSVATNSSSSETQATPSSSFTPPSTSSSTPLSTPSISPTQTDFFTIQPSVTPSPISTPLPTPSGSPMPTPQRPAKVGPWHVKIGNAFSSQYAAQSYVASMNKFGIPAYLAYNNGWYVYSGFYLDEKSAQNDIKQKMTSIVNGVSLTVVPPSAQSIAVLDKNTDPLLMYIGTEGVTFEPTTSNSPNIFKLNENTKLTYRGALQVRRYTGSDMTLINIVPMEQYLYGVLPSEIGSGAPVEALKAQAVVARTYAYMKKNRHKNYGFDVCTETHCQVYDGYSVESEKVKTNVNLTSDQVVKYNGKMADVYFFASSGGMTEDNENVWKNVHIPYLSAVSDPYEDPNSYRYNWEYQISAKHATELLGTKYGIGEVYNMKVTKTAKTGRVTELTIYGKTKNTTFLLERARTIFSMNSQMYTLSTDADIRALRLDKKTVDVQTVGKKIATSSGVKTIADKGQDVYVLGANGVRNSFPVKPEVFEFVGKGWGHAIGLSQVGAMGFANNGYNYVDIVKHYFVGTTVEKK